MILFADYEGLGVAIAQGLWLLLTAPAMLLAVGGIVAGALKQPRRTLAIWLGAAACVVEGAGIVIVCLALAEEFALHPAYAKHFQPGLFFYATSALTIAAALLAACLGITRKQPQSS